MLGLIEVVTGRIGRQSKDARANGGVRGVNFCTWPQTFPRKIVVDGSFDGEQRLERACRVD